MDNFQDFDYTLVGQVTVKHICVCDYRTPNVIERSFFASGSLR